MKKLLGLGAILGAVYYYGKKKYNDVQVLMNNISMKLVKIANVKFDNGALTLFVNLMIRNQSPTDLSFDGGGSILLKKIYFYDKSNQLIGTSKLDITRIEVAANSSIVVNNMPVVIPLADINNVVITALSLFSDPDQLKIKVELEVFGKTFTIDA